MFMQCMIPGDASLMMDIQKTYNNEYAAAATNGNQDEQSATFGLANAGNEFIIENMIARQANWQNLSDTKEHSRLHAALMQVQGN